MKTRAKRIRMLVAELMDTDQYWLEERNELIVETLTFLLLDGPTVHIAAKVENEEFLHSKLNYTINKQTNRHIYHHRHMHWHH
jgi:hypothetical protein